MVVLHQYHFTSAPYMYFIILTLMLHNKHLAIVNLLALEFYIYSNKSPT